MKMMTASAACIALLFACSGNSSGASEPPKPKAVLWDCRCTMSGTGFGSEVVWGTDKLPIPEKLRCSTTDPANSLEDGQPDFTCDPCKATATLCTAQ
jgi:hypothetical protein